MCIGRVINVRFLLWLSVGFSCCTITLGESCSTSELFSCGQNGMCKENSSHPGYGYCMCMMQFVREGNNCVHSRSRSPNPSVPVSYTVRPNENDDQKSSSRRDFPVALWLIVPCVIVAIVTGLVVAGRRYMWMETLYQLRTRHYDTVLINNQGDDDDDPPIV